MYWRAFPAKLATVAGSTNEVLGLGPARFEAAMRVEKITLATLYLPSAALLLSFARRSRRRDRCSSWPSTCKSRPIVSNQRNGETG
jgi:hypothetical protein